MSEKKDEKKEPTVPERRVRLVSQQRRPLEVLLANQSTVTLLGYCYVDVPESYTKSTQVSELVRTGRLLVTS
jgi:hypothetical protein